MFRWSAAIGVVIASTAFAQGTFQVIDRAETDTRYATSVSDDGSVVVGRFWGKTYWSREQGMVTLQSANTSGFLAVSGNGSTLVGEGSSGAWWRATGAPRGNHTSGGTVTGASQDGSVVSVNNSLATAWRPDSGSAVSLLSHESGGWISGISSDGTTIIGESLTLTGGGAKWDSSTGAVTPLGVFTPGRSVWARGTSADGTVVVGYSPSPGLPPLRWTAATGWQSIGTIGPLSAASHGAFGVSEDGSRVVGYSGGKAFIWFAPGSPTPAGVSSGMHDLNILLLQLGVDLAGCTLTSAMGISGDGSTIAGNCAGPDGSHVFVATIEPPHCPADLDNPSADGRPDGIVDINDLLRFLAEFEQGGSRADLDDDGVATRIADGAVDINDLLYFLFRFEDGC